MDESIQSAFSFFPPVMPSPNSPNLFFVLNVLVPRPALLAEPPDLLPCFLLQSELVCVCGDLGGFVLSARPVSCAASLGTSQLFRQVHKAGKVSLDNAEALHDLVQHRSGGRVHCRFFLQRPGPASAWTLAEAGMPVTAAVKPHLRGRPLPSRRRQPPDNPCRSARRPPLPDACPACSASPATRSAR